MGWDGCSDISTGPLLPSPPALTTLFFPFPFLFPLPFPLPLRSAPPHTCEERVRTGTETRIGRDMIKDGNLRSRDQILQRRQSHPLCTFSPTSPRRATPLDMIKRDINNNVGNSVMVKGPVVVPHGPVARVMFSHLCCLGGVYLNGLDDDHDGIDGWMDDE